MPEEEIKQPVESPEDVDKNRVDIIEIAKQRTQDLQKANTELEDQLRKHDKLIAETIVRGKSYAGQKEKSHEDEILDEAEKFANAMGRSFKK